MTKIKNEPNLWAVINTGRTTYNNQIVKSHAVKVSSMSYALENKYPNYHTFGKKFQSLASMLCDSKRFTDDCEKLKVIPNIVAQHVVFAGKKAFLQVRDYGLDSVFNSKQVLAFNEPLLADK